MKTKQKQVGKSVVVIAGLAEKPNQEPLTVETLNEKMSVGYELAKKLVLAYDLAGDAYREFCQYARDKLLPKEVTDILLLAGFNKQVVSRMKAVVSLPEPQFNEYKNKRISFNAALEKARENKGGAARSEKRNLAKTSKVWKAVSRLVVNDPGLTWASFVQRSSIAMIIPSTRDTEHSFNLDGVKVLVRVQAA